MKSLKSFSGTKASNTNYSQEVFEDQGLGRRFLDKLLQSKDKIHQVITYDLLLTEDVNFSDSRKLSVFSGNDLPLLPFHYAPKFLEIFFWHCCFNLIYEIVEDTCGGIFAIGKGCFLNEPWRVDALSGLTETNGSVRSRSIQVAIEMRSRGIHENDIILICSRAHTEQTVVILATLLLGAIVAPLDPETNLNELKTMVISLKPKMAFCDVRACRQFEVIIKDTEVQHCVIVVFGHTDRLMFDKFLLQKPDSDFDAVIIKEPKRRVAFVVPTQSTTGIPKLVCISHNSIRIQVGTYGNRILKGSERILSFFPLSWIAQVVIICYCFEAPVIRIIPGAFAERSACKLIHDLRIDAALLGTDYAMRIVRHASHQDYDLSCLKVVYVGGFITSAMDMAHLRTSFAGAKIFQCYGTTEMSCLAAAFPVDDYEAALERPGSVGKPMPGVKVKIVEFESRETLGADWWGELLVTGPTLMLGYYKDLPETNASLEKGYFRTGDVAQWDADGYIYIQGRLSDHIMAQGANFFPLELEQMILTHPYIREAVVLGNERDIVACVIKNPDCHLEAEALMEYLADRMPENKRPTKIKFLENFPKTPIGKVKKSLIRQMVLGITIVHSKSIVSFEGNPTNKNDEGHR